MCRQLRGLRHPRESQRPRELRCPRESRCPCEVLLVRGLRRPRDALLVRYVWNLINDWLAFRVRAVEEAVSSLWLCANKCGIALMCHLRQMCS